LEGVFEAVSPTSDHSAFAGGAVPWPGGKTIVFGLLKRAVEYFGRKGLACSQQIFELGPGFSMNFLASQAAQREVIADQLSAVSSQLEVSILTAMKAGSNSAGAGSSPPWSPQRSKTTPNIATGIPSPVD